MINCVSENQKTCNLCISSVLQAAPLLQIESIAKVVALKDYTGSSLKYCKKEILDKLFLPAEQIFQKVEDNDEVMK